MHGGDGCVFYNLGRVYNMQQQLDPAPVVYRGSAAGQAYVAARYAVGYISGFGFYMPGLVQYTCCLSAKTQP